MDAILTLERDILQRLLAEARAKFEMMERCDNVIRYLTIQINTPGISETPEADRLMAMLERATKIRQAVEAEYNALRIQIRRLKAGRTPPTGGGGGGTTLPRPPAGVISVSELDAIVKVLPSMQVFSAWGTQVKYPEMISQHHKVPNPQGTHAIINQPGTGGGGGGILAQATPPLLIKRCWLEGTGVAGYGPHTRWNCRGFGPADWSIMECYIFNNPDEHGFYLNSIYNLYFGKDKFEDIYSQAVQIVWREHEAVDFDSYMDPYGNGTRSLMVVDSCALIEVGRQAGGRPSFGLSFFEVQPWEGIRNTDVVIQGSYFESQKYENFEKSGGPYYSYGAIMIHGYQDVHLIANCIRHKKPNREVIQIWNCNDVVIEGCEVGDPFGGDEVLLDIRNCRGKVTIKGCTGNAKVQIMRNGPVYWWQNITFDYVGPITQDVVFEP